VKRKIKPALFIRVSSWRVKQQ